MSKERTPGKTTPMSPASSTGEDAPARRDTGAVSAADDVTRFLSDVRSMAPSTAGGRGRLIFAMDATMSRQPTWDMALALQADMFHAVREVGGLDVQLVYFRGAGECRASRWVTDADALARLMTTVDCRGGYTQIGKVLSHARQEAEKRKVSAMVYVGDCMEEGIDDLCGRAGELAMHGVPVFIFQEGNNGQAEVAFREIARLTKGAWCRFGDGSAGELRALLQAVAVYAAGGRAALERLGHAGTQSAARKLLGQMKS